MEDQDLNRSRTQMRLQKLVAKPMGESDHPQHNGANPFTAVSTQKPLVALKGKRNGYLMLATSQEILQYAELPDSLLTSAKTWAATLEKMGAPRVYWMTLSEVTPHLHIHLYPRWSEDDLKGIPLFEARESNPQPAWTELTEAALDKWALDFNVEIG
ncbi:MAG TPA: hypothetical protein V6C52_12040 [Coleofasciculaceae cyanobacterium]|jgi:diadenosine tetraphosphate (Ap4A) HIT family hydrolase